MLIFNQNTSVNTKARTPVKQISSVFEVKRTTTKNFKRSVLSQKNKQFLKSLGLTLRNE